MAIGTTILSLLWRLRHIFARRSKRTILRLILALFLLGCAAPFSLGGAGEITVKDARGQVMAISNSLPSQECTFGPCISVTITPGNELPGMCKSPRLYHYCCKGDNDIIYECCKAVREYKGC
jgi:hypothetical protein